MKIGDVVHAKSIRRIFKNELAEGWENYKAPTGERFVFMLLGSEPLDGPELDPIAVLNALGWSAALSPNGAAK